MYHVDPSERLGATTTHNHHTQRTRLAIKHQETARSKLYYTFFLQEVHNLLLKEGVLDDMLHVDDGGCRHSVTTEFGN